MSATSIYEDGTYLENNPTWHEEDSAWKATQIKQLLHRNHIVPKSLCEVGCGAGEILDCMSAAFGDEVEVFGYEISPQAFDICHKKEKQHLHYFLGDLLEQELQPFDVVMAIDVFEHVEDYRGFLRKLKRRGTYQVFHIPLDLSVQAVLRKSPIVYLRESVGHIHNFTKETALGTLNDTGYEVVDCCYTCGVLELPNRGWKANLLKFPRKVLFSINEDLTARVLGGFSLLVLAK